MRAAVPHVLRRSDVAQAPNYRRKDLNLVPPLAAADAGALMTSSQIWLKCYGCGTRPTARLSQLSRDRPPLPPPCAACSKRRCKSSSQRAPATCSPPSEQHFYSTFFTSYGVVTTTAADMEQSWTKLSAMSPVPECKE